MFVLCVLVAVVADLVVVVLLLVLLLSVAVRAPAPVVVDSPVVRAMTLRVVLPVLGLLFVQRHNRP